MTFQQARAISKTNKLHIRRAAWTDDKWFMIWRGTWFVFSTGLLKPVCATDYAASDLLATDWTTVPAALAACPITPTEPIGGGDPTPGQGIFPDDPFKFPTRAGAPGGGSGSISLPTPAPGTSTGITVVFSGLPDHDDQDPMNPGYVAHLHLNRTIPFSLSGGTVHFKTGHQPNKPGGDTVPEDFIDWTATAEVSGGLWSVHLVCEDTSIGGSFTTAEPKPPGDTIFNLIGEGSGFVHGGQAVVTIN